MKRGIKHRRPRTLRVCSTVVSLTGMFIVPLPITLSGQGKRYPCCSFSEQLVEIDTRTPESALAGAQDDAGEPAARLTQRLRDRRLRSATVRPLSRPLGGQHLFLRQTHLPAPSFNIAKPKPPIPAYLEAWQFALGEHPVDRGGMAV